MTRLTVGADHWDEFLSRIQAVLADFAQRAFVPRRKHP